MRLRDIKVGQKVKIMLSKVGKEVLPGYHGRMGSM